MAKRKNESEKANQAEQGSIIPKKAAAIASTAVLEAGLDWGFAFFVVLGGI